MKTEVSRERIERYLEITRKALDKIEVCPPARSFGRKMAEDFLNMASSYYEDAVHFKEEGDFVNAFACVNYAHGWLDCGARIGIFEVEEDDKLFTLYE